MGRNLLVTVLCLFISISSYAREFHLIELKAATIGYKSFFPGSHDPLLNESGLKDRQLGKQVNLNFDMDVAKYLYWNNRVHGTTDEIVENGQGTGKGQFRKVGWNFQVGIRASSALSLEYEHHSQHLLDWDRHNRFPVEDSVGIKLFIYRAPEQSETIF